MDARRLPPPLAERPVGPFVLRLFPAAHPTADLEKALAVVGVVAFAALLFVPLDALVPFGAPCRFRSWTGYPCPTCGATRAGLALARFDLSRALEMNPLLTLLALAVLAATPLAAAAWARGWPRPRIGLRSAAGRRAAVGIAVLLVLANWAFLVAAGR